MLTAASFVPNTIYTRAPAVTLTYVEALSSSQATEVCVSGAVATACFPRSMTSLALTLLGADGPKNISVTLKNAAGNVSAPIVVTITLDTTAPSFTFSLDEDTGYVRSQSPTFHFVTTHTDVESIKVKVDSGSFGAAIPYSANPSIPLGAITEGAHVIAAQLIDFAGNTFHTAVAITVDTERPLFEDLKLLGPNPWATHSNTREPTFGLFLRYADPDLVFCSLITAGGTAATTPVQGDACWAPNPNSILSAFTIRSPRLPAVEGNYRLTVFARDLAGNIGSIHYDFAYDITPPSGVVALTSITTGHRSATVTWNVLTPFTDTGSGFDGFDFGYDPTNSATNDPAQYVWRRLVSVYNTSAKVELPNGVPSRMTLRAIDRAGNAAPIDLLNVRANITANWAWTPLLTTPTTNELTHALMVRVNNGHRFLVAGKGGMLFSSDDDGQTWVRRDPLFDQSTIALYEDGNGDVVILSQGKYSVSHDQGRTFESGIATPRSRATAFVELTPGPNDLGRRFLSATTDPREPFVLQVAGDTGSPFVNIPLAGPPGNAPVTHMVSVGNKVLIARTFELFSFDGITFTPIALPVPAGSLIRSLHARGNDVVLAVTKNQSGQATAILRSVDGGQTFAEVAGPTWDIGEQALDVTSDLTSAWVLTDRSIRKLTYTSATGATEQKLLIAPGARTHLAGTGTAVVTVGPRGALYSTGTFPTADTLRKNNALPNLASISVRTGTAQAQAAASSIVAISGAESFAAYTSNSGASWTTAALAGTANISSISATDVAQGFIAGAGTSSASVASLFINPQTGWQNRTPAPAPSSWNAIACSNALLACWVAGSQGSFGRLSLGASQPATVVVSPSTTTTWRDLDIATVGGVTWSAAVGFDAPSNTSKIALTNTTTSFPVVFTTPVGVVLNTIAIRRNEPQFNDPLFVLALGNDGKAYFTTGGSTWTDGSLSWLYLFDVLDLVNLNGSSWFAVGRNGSAAVLDFNGYGNSINSTPSFTNQGADLVGVAVSDSNPDVIFAVSAEGGLIRTTVGGRTKP